MNFRADINGLRFLAVSMVVLFHFKFPFFFGGYAGVDVFFVISGFLMSKIFLKTLDKNGSRGILLFYKDRFSRIYPALLSAILLTAVFILATEPPSTFLEFGQEALASLAFLSNMFYWRSSGYFDTTADLRWLLHTWSLSVEWQFYILFPLLVYIIKKIFKTGYLLTTYLLMAAFSFAICITLAKHYPTFAFYSLPTRAWELFLGAAISLTRNNHSLKISRFFEMAGIGALILFTILAKESSSWPGFLTLIPVVATAAIIYANIDNKNSLLRFKPLQFIGSISYSLYLYHWLIVSYMANHAIEFTPASQLIGIIASIGMGVISYKYLERWNYKKIKFSLAFLIPGACLASILFITGVIKNTTSEKDLVLDSYASYSKSENNTKQFGNKCFLTSGNIGFIDFDKKHCLGNPESKKNILLIGDSHAAELSQSLREKFPDFNIMQATASGCLPFSNTDGADRCVDMMNYIYNHLIKNEHFDMVIMSANWTNNSIPYIKERIKKSIEELSLSTRNTYVIGQTRTLPINGYRLAQISKNGDITKYTSEESITHNHQLMAYAKENKIQYIDVFNLGCKNATCPVTDDSGIPIMFDRNHLTKEWADKQVDMIKSSITSISKQ